MTEPAEPGPLLVMAARERDRADRLMTGYGNASFLMEIYPGGRRHVAHTLKLADRLTLRDEMEDVGGNACYVLEAETPRGAYQIWVDPEHGFHVRRALILRGDPYALGDRAFVNADEMGLGPARSPWWEIQVSGIEIEKIDGRYVVTAGTMTSKHQGFRGSTGIDRHEARRSEIRWYPDFEAMGAFAMDRVPEGAPVFIDEDGAGLKLGYVWRRGEAVPKRPEGVKRTTGPIG